MVNTRRFIWYQVMYIFAYFIIAAFSDGNEKNI